MRKEEPKDEKKDFLLADVHEYQKGEVTGLSIEEAKEVQCNGEAYFSCRAAVQDSFIYDGEMHSTCAATLPVGKITRLTLRVLT